MEDAPHHRAAGRRRRAAARRRAQRARPAARGGRCEPWTTAASTRAAADPAAGARRGRRADRRPPVHFGRAARRSRSSTCATAHGIVAAAARRRRRSRSSRAAIRRRSARALRELGIRHVQPGRGRQGRGARRSCCATLGVAAAQAAPASATTRPTCRCCARRGLAVAVADAHPALDAAAHWVTRLAGRPGAVREVCDCCCSARARLNRRIVTIAVAASRASRCSTALLSGRGGTRTTESGTAADRARLLR